MLHSQNLNGYNGLLLVPGAEIAEQGRITFGANYFHSSLNSFSRFKKDGYSYYVNLSFLPFLEFHGLIVRNMHEDGSTLGIGDRTISVRVKPVSETEHMPSLLVGWQNIGTAFGGEEAVYHHSLYLAATKNFNLLEGLKAGITGGYGTRLMTAADYQFQGVFGGIEFKYSPGVLHSSLSLLTEYDAERFNAGVRMILFDHLNLIAGFIDMKHLSGGASISWDL
jgi:hypothetical protein